MSLESDLDYGVSARLELGLLVTSDVIDPASTLNAAPGDPVLRHPRVGPRDPLGRAFTAGMFDGQVCHVDTINGTARSVFDCETIVPHVEVPVRGGMTRILAMPESGDRLIFASFQAGRVGMLDVSDPEHPVQSGIANLGVGAGPHDIGLTEDDRRLIVTDSFLSEDDFAKIHFEGDHRVNVIRVYRDKLKLDERFQLDLDTACATGPARPHGMESK